MSTEDADDVIRHRVEVQGFSGLDAEDLGTLVPWLRFTPAVNLVVATLGTALASPPILYGLAASMALGVLLPAHPWDYLYNAVLRSITGTRPLPKSGWRRRLTFSIGAPWLTATGLAFAGGHATLGYSLGGVMAVLMLPLATIHWCVVSEIVDRIAGQKGRGSCELRSDHSQNA